MTVRPLIYLIFIIAVLSFGVGCTTTPEFKDGYQFGDISRVKQRELAALEQVRRDYCDLAQTSILRSVALTYLRAKQPAIPKDGICQKPIEQLIIDNEERFLENIRDGPASADESNS